MMELAPHSIMHTTPLPRLHRQLRTLGLRHIFVTDTRNEVMGVVTRKDLLPEVLAANVHESTAAKAGGGKGARLRGLKRRSSNKVLAEHGGNAALFVQSKSMV